MPVLEWPSAAKSTASSERIPPDEMPAATDDILSSETATVQEPPPRQPVESERQAPEPPSTPAPAEGDHATEPSVQKSRRVIAGASAIAQLAVSFLVLLDRPFAGLSLKVKTFIGCAGIATSLVAAATWIIGPQLVHH